MIRIKDQLRSLLIKYSLDITKNIKYDRLTKIILQKHIKTDWNCIDVGSHKGEIMDMILGFAPQGHHIGFEPLPDMYDALQNKYMEKVKMYNCALSHYSGSTTFNHVLDAPAYSGLQERKYTTSNPRITQIEVKVCRLDELISESDHIHFIKIDVEGGEYDVLRGSEKLLERCHPLLLFECGKGASEYYGTKPEDLHKFLSTFGYKIYTLQNFEKGLQSLSCHHFEATFYENKEYYFVGAV